MFLQNSNEGETLDSAVAKYLGDYDITIIEFLDQILPENLAANDISVTKFLDDQIAKYFDDSSNSTDSY